MPARKVDPTDETCNLSLRVPSRYRAALEANAQQQGKPLSTYVREILRREIAATEVKKGDTKR